MFKIVHTVCYVLLHKLPIVEALYQTTEILHVGRLLIVQKLHKNLTLCISIEYHLQIRRHWQNDIHRHTLRINTHECQQAIQIGIMAEAQIRPHASSGDSCIGIGLNTTPKRNSTTGGNTIILNFIAIIQRHPAVVYVVDRQQFLIREYIIERHVQLHILHIRSDGMQFRKQLLPILLRQMAGIRKQRIDKPVGRYRQRPVLRVLKITLLL